METTTTRAIYDLQDLMDEHVTTSNLVTRETGRSMRESIELGWSVNRKGQSSRWISRTWVLSTFPVLMRSSASSWHACRGWSMAINIVVLHGLTPTHEENIAVALERKKLAVLVSRPDGSWRLLGSLNPYLNEALQFVMHQKEITARDLADDTQVEISLASTKLLNLFKARLVQRSSERLPDGGRQFIYRSLFVER